MSKGGKRTGAGRRQGSKNKVTQVTREAFKMLVEGQFDNLNTWITLTAKDNPKDAFYMVMELAAFCVPKMKSIEMTGKDGETLEFIVDLKKAL